MDVIRVAEKDLWVLEADGLALALGLSPAGLLTQTYLGPRLPAASDYPAAVTHPGWASFDSGPELTAELFSAWGGVRFKECCLEAEYADGTRNVLLEFRGATPLPSGLELHWQDPGYPLSVHMAVTSPPQGGLFRFSTRVENRGDQPLSIRHLFAASLQMPRADAYRLTHHTGHWVGEFSLRQDYLPWGKTVLESRRGFTGHHLSPWFALDADGKADESSGRVYFGALEHSGNWKMVFERNSFNQVTVSAGFNDFDFRWRLEAGEVLEAPAWVVGLSEAGFGEASRALHRHVRDHVLHPSDRGGRRVLYNSWEATFFDVSEEGQGRLADMAAGLGVELFVMDDGWFGERSSDRAGLGDWSVNSKKFPKGLHGLIERVKSLGMEFGLWVEPEMVNPDSDLYRAHPDWVYHFPTRPRSEMRNQLVLNLAIPEVAEFVWNTMDRLLSEHDIRFIKWDLNRNVSEPGWAGAPESRSQEIWARHTQAIYAIISRLKAKHPHVLFQSCSGGGGRVDLGILRGFGQVWPSDNTDAFDRLLIQEGFSFAYPAKIMEAWVTEEENWLNKRHLPLRYRFHVAMMGNLGLGANITHWSEQEQGEARQLVAEYKAVRSIIHEGDLFRIHSPRASNLAASLYRSRDGKEAVLFVFAHGRHMGSPWPAIPLPGLDATRQYRRQDTGETLSGSAWFELGARVELEAMEFSSAMIRFSQTGTT